MCLINYTVLGELVIHMYSFRYGKLLFMTSYIEKRCWLFFVVVFLVKMNFLFASLCMLEQRG